MRLVVFGSGGFVGGWVCEELSLRRDITFVACVRKWASAVRLARRGLDIRQADLESTKELSSLLDGVDVVINATMPPPTREPDLVSSLFHTCAEHGVRRFVQFSSAAVYGSRTGHVNETMAPAPADDYSRGKAEMEKRLQQAALNSSTQLFILRPSIIYGPFSDAWTVRYVERIIKGRWRGLGQLGAGTCNLVHAHDVALAAIAAATNQVEAGTHVLNINGPDVVSWNEYIERLGDALGVTGRVTPNTTAFRVMAVAAEIMRLGATLTAVRSLYRRSIGPTRSAMESAKAVTKLYPSSEELNLLGRKVHYSAEQATHVLGMKPSTRLDDGLRQSVAWCQVHGLA